MKRLFSVLMFFLKPILIAISAQPFFNEYDIPGQPEAAANKTLGYRQTILSSESIVQPGLPEKVSR